MQNNKTPLISLRAASLGGSNYENNDINGSFGLLSEIFLRGSEKFTKNEIAMKTEILGSEFSGFSGRNSFGIKMIGPSDHIDKLIPIFSDVLLNPRFLDSEFEIAKSVPSISDTHIPRFDDSSQNPLVSNEHPHCSCDSDMTKLCQHLF